MNKIDVVIPYFNSGSLTQTLASLENSFRYINKVILVNDGGKKIKASSDLLEIETHSLPENRGPSAARNFGFLRTSTDYVLFVDSDVALKESAITKLISAISTCHGIDVFQGMYSKYEKTVNIPTKYKDIYMVNLFEEKKDQVSFVYGGCFAVNRKKFLGFNEKVRIGEDTEYANRVLKSGGQIKLLKAMKFQHLKEYSWASLLKNNFLVPFHFVRTFLKKEKAKKVNRGFSHASLFQLLLIASLPFIFMLSLASLELGLIFFVTYLIFINHYYRPSQQDMGPVDKIRQIILTPLDQLIQLAGICSGLVYFLFLNRKAAID